MEKIYQRRLLWMVIGVALWGAAQVYAQPAVTLRLDPDVRTIVVGAGPQAIKITTLTNTPKVQFTWKIEGEGKYEEKNPNSGILYLLPSAIQADTTTTVTVVVTDEEQRTAADSVTFNLVVKPDTAQQSLEEQQNNLNDLLQQAETLFKQKDYLTPPGKNAFALYITVLEIAPDNAQALEKLHQILDNYKTWGDNLYNAHYDSMRAKDYYEKCLVVAEYLNLEETATELSKRIKILTLLEEAKKLFNPNEFHFLPKSSQFEAYKNSVQNAVGYYQEILVVEPKNEAAQSRVSKILEMNLKWADYAYQQKWFTTPEGRSAFDYYKLIIFIAPQHQEAQKRIRAITDDYRGRGDEEYNKGNQEEAKKWYDRYLVVADYLLHELNERTIESEYRRVSEKIKALTVPSSVENPSGTKSSES